MTPLTICRPHPDGPHEYHFVIHALDVETLDQPGTAWFTMFTHTLARARLIGTFEQ